MKNILFIGREFFDAFISLFRDHITPALQDIRQFFVSMVSPSVKGSIGWYLRKWTGK